MRESLRRKGQFWTPAWLAEAMVGYVLTNGSKELFDPAVGAGAFLKAAKTLACQQGKELALFGMEFDPDALILAQQNGLSSKDLAHVQLGDFVLNPPQRSYKAIVANPPYIRHHHLPEATKLILKRFAVSLLGTALDGRTGLHVYFLLHALQKLSKGGKLAFILPADVFEGVFARTLWNWITTHFCLEAIVTFAPSASPFPQIDTNPIVVFLQNVTPNQNFYWVECTSYQKDALRTWMIAGCIGNASNNLFLQKRSIAEGLSTGFSRKPQTDIKGKYVLGDFAKVMRGIATGSNDFFFLTVEQTRRLEIAEEFLISAIGRTRDVSGHEITLATLDELQLKNRPTRLLTLDNRAMEDFPASVYSYLKQGEALGINQRELIKQRRPWYKMETRLVPPLLFAYLGRRNVRFIYNSAGVVPLTGFLCVYPYSNSPNDISKLGQVLNHPDTIANLRLVGKSYGDGAIKVEPRSLEALPLPQQLIEAAGLAQVILETKQLLVTTNKSDLELVQMSFL